MGEIFSGFADFVVGGGGGDRLVCGLDVWACAETAVENGDLFEVGTVGIAV